MVVAPRIVIASPKLGIASEQTKANVTRANEARKFYLVVILGLIPVIGSAFMNISSRVFLQGSIVTGKAKIITTRIPKREMKLTTPSG